MMERISGSSRKPEPEVDGLDEDDALLMTASDQPQHGGFAGPTQEAFIGEKHKIFAIMDAWTSLVL
jgi:hypothetical protein